MVTAKTSLFSKQPRVLMDGANGDRMLHLTKMKEHVYFFRSTVSPALALDGDWTRAYLKDKNRWSPCLITITEVAPQGSSYKVNLKVLIKKMHLTCNWFVEKSKFIRDRKCFFNFCRIPSVPPFFWLQLFSQNLDQILTFSSVLGFKTKPCSFKTL